MSQAQDYFPLIRYYESCFEAFGDTPRGFGWPKDEDVRTRFEIMLGVIKRDSASKPIRLLDFGCGSSHLQEYILQNQIENIIYSGLDLSEKIIELSKAKFPGNEYYCMDVLTDEVSLPSFDYIVMNGVFTVKRELPFADMLHFFKSVVKRLFNHAEIGIAFNIMSKHVDWERDDLFHLPLDTLAAFLTRELTRNYVIRNDYGLYEFTAYVYH
jgi:SAM-dependent methyltransferase